MSEGTPKVPLMAKVRFLFIGLVLGLLVGSAGVGKVWWDGRGALQDAEAALEAAEQDATSQQAALQGQIDAATRLVSLLESRRSLAMASAELGRGNYGTAGERLGDAARHLSGVEDAAPLRARIGDITLVATDDPTGQQGLVEELAVAVDALIAP